MDQIGKLLDRPRLYFNIDGLGELGGGVLCLGFALVLPSMTRWPAHSFWHRISFFVFVALALLIRYGTKTTKARITYPRTGFVEYRKQWHTSAIAAAVGALVMTCLAVGVRRGWDIAMLAPLTGLVFAAAYGYHFVRAVRWKWVIVGAIAVASLVIAFLFADVLRALGSESPVVQPNRAKPLGNHSAISAIFNCLWRDAAGFRLHEFLALSSPYAVSSAGRPMNQQIRTIADLDRVIHEPGRLMIAALLFAVDRADFLCLQHETAMNKGTLSSHLSRLEEAGYVAITKTYPGKVPQTLLSLTGAGRKAFEQYRRNLKQAL